MFYKRKKKVVIKPSFEGCFHRR